jgi:hypothetical protein
MIQAIGRIGERVSVSTNHALKKLQTFINPNNNNNNESAPPNDTVFGNSFYTHSQMNLSPHLQEAAIFSMKGRFSRCHKYQF